ncbi:hypothetical protein NKJ52_10530 [Mesorhizobium australicum]
MLTANGCFDAIIEKAPGELRWMADRGGGATMDLGCYVLHALGREGEVLRAYATVIDGVDAELAAELRFGDVAARMSCSMIAPRRNWIRFQGTTGTLLFESHGDGSALLLAARSAYTSAADITFLTAAGIVLLTAIVAVTMLRGLKTQG